MMRLIICFHGATRLKIHVDPKKFNRQRIHFLCVRYLTLTKHSSYAREKQSSYAREKQSSYARERHARLRSNEASDNTVVPPLEAAQLRRTLDEIREKIEVRFVRVAVCEKCE